MKRIPALLVVLLLLVPASVLPGCVGITGRRDVSSWFEARGADLMDVVGVRVAFGAGLGVYARATRFVQLGFMARGPSEAHFTGALFGAEGDAFSVRAVPCFQFGTIGRYGGAWFDSTREAMIPGYSTRDGDVPLIHRKVVAGVVSVDGSGDRMRYSFGAGAHLLLVGAEAEVRPVQLFDFVAGLVGYDPSGDDVPVDGSGRPAN